MNKIVVLLFLMITLAVPYQIAYAQDQKPQPVYIVQEGDTLNIIAAKFNVSPEEIIQINNFQNPDILSLGQQIRIPGFDGIGGILTTKSVALGENLDSVSIKNSIPLDILLRLNKTTSPDELFMGSPLIFPADDTRKTYNSSLYIDQNTTPLESSASTGINQYSYLFSTQGDSVWNNAPGKTIFFSLSGEGKLANPISPTINSIMVSPLPIVQGNTIEITINTKEPVQLSGQLNGHVLNFFSSATNEYIALQGIYALANPGVTDFSLTGKFADGSDFSFSQSVLVSPGVFGKDPPLSVDPETIDPKNTKPEEQLLLSKVKDATPIKMWNGIFRLPVDEPYCIKSYYGNRRSYNGGTLTSFHTGLDFGVCANFNILSPADGIVVYEGEQTVRGNMTIIDHGWGVYSGFYHQKEIFVKVGDKVSAGQIIGAIGDTGRVTGPHLHYEIWVNGVQVEPITWLFDRVFP